MPNVKEDLAENKINDRSDENINWYVVNTANEFLESCSSFTQSIH